MRPTKMFGKVWSIELHNQVLLADTANRLLGAKHLFESWEPLKWLRNSMCLWNMKICYLVRFQVPMVMNMKMTVFWDITAYGVTEINWHFRVSFCLHHQASDNGGNYLLWNVSQFLLDYKIQHPSNSHLYSLSSLQTSVTCSYPTESYPHSETICPPLSMLKYHCVLFTWSFENRILYACPAYNHLYL
jgi:hypothetical protein